MVGWLHRRVHAKGPRIGGPRPRICTHASAVRSIRSWSLCSSMVRSSLGRSIELSTTRTGTGTYGFYALPIAHLLELTEWVPHQDLLAAGKLVEVKPDDTETEVVFCSHQWTSFDAPDPTMDQLKVLQSVIRKLMAGKTEVRSNGMLDAVYASCQQEALQVLDERNLQ